MYMLIAISNKSRFAWYPLLTRCANGLAPANRLGLVLVLKVHLHSRASYESALLLTKAGLGLDSPVLCHVNRMTHKDRARCSVLALQLVHHVYQARF